MCVKRELITYIMQCVGKEFYLQSHHLPFRYARPQAHSSASGNVLEKAYEENAILSRLTRK